VSKGSSNLPGVRAAAVLRDLEINPMTLKLEDDLDILKMYLHKVKEK